MGYKLPPGQDNYLPSSFRGVYQQQDYSPPTIVRSNEDILRSIERARDVFARHGVRIRQGNSLDRLFVNASSRLRGKKPHTPLGDVDNNFVAVLAGLVIAFEDEPGIKVVLEKIAGSDIAISSRRQSPGKDMIWELTMLSNFRMSAIPSKIAEPDIVTDFGFGEYGVACKKIYSENSVEKAVKKGITQLGVSKLRGVIALNLDELIVPPNRLLYASSQDFFRNMLENYISEFFSRHQNILDKYAPNNVCDGYIIYLGAIGYIIDAKCILPAAVNCIYDPCKEESKQNSRLHALGAKFGRADGLAEWVKKVGGKTEIW
jgi:hypothetical protein